MFQFLMGVMVGFFLVWAFRNQSAGTEMREHAEHLGRTAEQKAQQMTNEARGTMESFRERTTS